MKPIMFLALLVVVVIIIVPAVLVLPFSGEKASGELTEQVVSEKKDKAKTNEPSVEVAVYRKAENTIQSLELEEYLVGVVAAEMPADFEKEAIKAQALTARTYIVSQMMKGNKKGLPKGADVDDSQDYQVYKNQAELKKLWGSDYKWKLNKIKEAVEETAGEILTYDGEPITAAFFSTSNGYTENSEDYWENEYPYLKSVSSPWDKDSPKYTNKVTMSVKDFENKLGVQIANSNEIGTVIKRTAGKRVGTVKISGKQLSGREIRDLLGLQSSDFTWTRSGDVITITTKGFGHGVGMSQYGANGMAKEGKNYKEIVKHYYKDVEIKPSNQWLNTLLAKK